MIITNNVLPQTGGSCAASKSSVASSSLSKRSSVENDRNFFNFGEARVQEYLSSLPEENSSIARSSNHSSSHSGSHSTSVSALSIASCMAHCISGPSSQSSTTSSVASSTNISNTSTTSGIVPSLETAIPMEIDYVDPPPPVLKLQAPPSLQPQASLHSRRHIAANALTHDHQPPIHLNAHHHAQDQVPPLLSPFYKYEPIMTRSRKRRIDNQSCYPNGCPRGNCAPGHCPCGMFGLGNGGLGPINLVVASSNINNNDSRQFVGSRNGRSTRFGFSDVAVSTVTSGASMETEPIRLGESHIQGTKSKRRKVKVVM